MRVSIVNFCSTALEMLKFSTERMWTNAGTDDFDYIVVVWNPSPEVEAWLRDNTINSRYYETRTELAYVPNLRAMMSFGFDEGYKLNDYVVIVNTDCMFGNEWLSNLVKHASEDVIPNSLHLSPIQWPSVYNVNLGCPSTKEFDEARFWNLVAALSEDRVETEAQRTFPGYEPWQGCASMPYVLHRKWWEKYGPWEPVMGPNDTLPPDQRFFRRVHEGGAKFIYVRNSIVYHHEAVERRGKQRPVGIENMPEGR